MDTDRTEAKICSAASAYQAGASDADIRAELVTAGLDDAEAFLIAQAARILAGVPATPRRPRYRAHEAFTLVLMALERELVVQSPHPNFGGSMTAGPFQPAVGPLTWALIHHGGRPHVGDDEGFASPTARASAFIFQVGKQLAGEAGARAAKIL